MSEGLGALSVAYRDLAQFAAWLDEPASWRPTGCAGWAVRDLVFHLLGDAQRALVAFATPASRPADRDAVTYWIDAPGQADPESRNLRATRTMASAWRLTGLTVAYRETARAVVTMAGRVAPHALIETQGHVLRADDLVTTLAVEAAVHHLDLVVDLDRPGPGPEPLALVRRTLDRLLGHPVPVNWDDETWARAGTGRRRLSPAEQEMQGDDAARFPLRQ
ncbi:MAG: maleylpyruvate isomerase N-terminal domain-containing protein [Actinomycetota bacterium]|nr:maleylpyruvate isomerase N-terminal domain-containing protein [Actinomycetota bacterium]